MSIATHTLGYCPFAQFFLIGSKFQHNLLQGKYHAFIAETCINIIVMGSTRDKVSNIRQHSSDIKDLSIFFSYLNQHSSEFANSCLCR